MDIGKKGETLMAATVLLLVVALIGGCGSPDENMPPASGASGATMAGMDICTTCHSNETSDWLNSGHANLGPTNELTSYGVPTLGLVVALGTCATCHDPTGDSANLTAGYTGNARPVVGCEACHGAGSLHVDQSGIGPISLLSNTASRVIGTTQVSGQFMMCTECHELLDSSGTGTVPSAHDPTGAEAASASGEQYVITDSHFATPGSYTGSQSANVNDITGYSMDFSHDRVCIDCHNPHGPADINREWAQSKHADTTAAGAWAHYNWSCNGSSSTGCGTSSAGSPNDRRMCARCHTTTGFAAFTDALRSGDSELAGLISEGSVTLIDASSDWKPEMLKCNGCHTNYQGELRNPGAYTASYDYSTDGVSAVASHSYADASSSNVCIPCHSGRQNGDSLKNMLFSDETTTSFSNLSFIDPHYLTAAGTVYTATGYGYGRTYANPGTYKHDKIGSASVSNTGSGGSCVGCHMYRTGGSPSHLYRSVNIDDAGEVTGIVSEVCYECHAGSSSSLAAIVENERIEYEDALAALITALDRKGMSFRSSFPYIYRQRIATGTIEVLAGSPTVTATGADFVSAGTSTSSSAPDYFRAEVEAKAYKIIDFTTDTLTLSEAFTGPSKTNSNYVVMRSGRSNAVKDWLFGGSQSDGRNNMGAAFNLQLLEHEPGAYIHNSKYTKRLIYDSIDWVDDGSLNYSTGVRLDSLPAETTYREGAMNYLLPSGVLWSGTYPSGYGVSSERP